MWPQLYDVCYCLSNSCAIVFRHNPRFDYRPQFQDRQKPHPLISRRAVRRRHYRPRMKSQKTVRSVVGVEPTTFRTAATDNDNRLAPLPKRPPRPNKSPPSSSTCDTRYCYSVENTESLLLIQTLLLYLIKNV